MAAYLITYDLKNPGQKYEKVHQAIKDSSINWCHYWDSSWLIKSNKTPDEITNSISPHLDSNDKLIVIEVKSNYQGWMSEEQWKWIRENIFN